MKGVCGMEPRNAIVTGASHGIGQYIARALAARRMNLLLVARSQAEHSLHLGLPRFVGL